MACPIKIKDKLVAHVEKATDHALNKSLPEAQEIGRRVNDSFGMPVVRFSQTDGDYIDRAINIPPALVEIYYQNELRMLLRKSWLKKKNLE